MKTVSPGSGCLVRVLGREGVELCSPTRANTAPQRDKSIAPARQLRQRRQRLLQPSNGSSAPGTTDPPHPHVPAPAPGAANHPAKRGPHPSAHGSSGRGRAPTLSRPGGPRPPCRSPRLSPAPRERRDPAAAHGGAVAPLLRRPRGSIVPRGAAPTRVGPGAAPGQGPARGGCSAAAGGKGASRPAEARGAPPAQPGHAWPPRPRRTHRTAAAARAAPRSAPGEGRRAGPGGPGLSQPRRPAGGSSGEPGPCGVRGSPGEEHGRVRAPPVTRAQRRVPSNAARDSHVVFSPSQPRLSISAARERGAMARSKPLPRRSCSPPSHPTGGTAPTHTAMPVPRQCQCPEHPQTKTKRQEHLRGSLQLRMQTPQYPTDDPACQRQVLHWRRPDCPYLG